MEDKNLLVAIAASLQQMPAAAVPVGTVAHVVMLNNQLVADAASEMMAIETVPQPPRPLIPGDGA